MKVRFIFNAKFTEWFGVAAITLYPFVFTRMDAATALRTHTIAHELVHVHQVRKLGWFKFYASYLWHFIKVFVKGGSYNEAYYTNPYEVEAYETEAQKDLQKEAEEVVKTHLA
jgi:hypothetical protein